MDDLNSLTLLHLAQARDAPHGRSSHLVLHQNLLRQTLIALTADTVLDEHEAPHAASLQVLHGRVLLTSPTGDIELTVDQLAPVPQERHGLRALEDSAVLLTTVTNV